MLKLISSLLVLVSCLSLYGQNYFDHTLDIDSMPNNYRSLAKLNNSYYVGGDVLIVGDRHALTFSKYDSDGLEQWTVKHGDTLEIYYCENIIAANKALFLFGEFWDSSNTLSQLYMANFDTNGIHKWTNYYGYANLDEYMSDVITTKSMNFLIIASSKELAGSSYDSHVLMLDSVGNVLWENRIGIDNNQEWGIDGVEIENNSYLISGSTINGNGNKDKYLIKIDSNGNFLWDTAWGMSGSDDRYLYVAESMGNFALFVSGVRTGATSKEIHLYDIDGNGDFVWDKKLQYPSEPNITKITKTEDGTYLLTGSNSPNGYAQPLIIKITPRGDTIWSRTFSKQTNKHNYLYDILENEDGTYVFAGTNHPITQDGWIKSLDCMGCDSVACYFPDSCYVYDCHNDYPPVADFSLGQDTFKYKQGDTISVKFMNNSSASSAYTWYFGPSTGDSANLVHPRYEFTAPGDYEITLVARNLECSDTIKDTLHILDATGIAEEAQLQSFRVYPNPSKDQFYIKLIGAPAHREIMVTDIMGKIITSTPIQKLHATVDLRSYPSGVYFLRLYENGVPVGVKKLILEQ